MEYSNYGDRFGGCTQDGCIGIWSHDNNDFHIKPKVLFKVYFLAEEEWYRDIPIRQQD